MTYTLFLSLTNWRLPLTNYSPIALKKSPETLINQHFWESTSRAIDGARTRGLDLGKVARYQLRHYRKCVA